MNKKIICVGLPKTATTSLHYSLIRLGFTSVHYPLDVYKHSSSLIAFKLYINQLYRRLIRVIRLKKIPFFKNKKFYVFSKLYSKSNKLILDLDFFRKYDAFSDLPMCHFYKEIDRNLSDDKIFICTVRDKKSWLESCKKHYTRNPFNEYSIGAQLRFSFFGQHKFDEHIWSKKYDEFYSGINEYFKTREKDILMINITGGEGYEKLCPFLNKKLIDEKIPKKNPHYRREK